MDERLLNIYSEHPEITDTPLQQLARWYGFVHMNAAPPRHWNQVPWTSLFSETPFRASNVLTTTPAAQMQWQTMGQRPIPVTYPELALPFHQLGPLLEQRRQQLYEVPLTLSTTP